MSERLFFLSYKLPSLAIGASIIVVSLFLALFVQGCVKTAATYPQPASAFNSSTIYYSESQNLLVASVDEAAYAIRQDLDKPAHLANGGLHYVAAVASEHGKLLAKGIQTMAANIGKGIMAMVHTTANVFIFVLRIPGNIFGFVANSRVAGAIIAPSEHTHNNEVPIIDPNDPALLAAQKALPAIASENKVAAPGSAQEIAWPIRGAITTHFGERGRYYRPAHTGIDISDGKRPGVTPIKAYRSGTVSAAGRDGGLGNRVIVDHGNGVTSVYAHLSSISVGLGQKVDTNTTLGLEGSTGVSTGTHLHFEIRINGQAADPLLFIAGRP